jgi:hypothetical protein
VFSEKKAASLFFLVTVLLLGVSIVVHLLLFAGFNTRDRFPILWTFLQYAIVIGFIPKAIDWVRKLCHSIAVAVLCGDWDE